VRQRPGSAQGVIFMTLEDETGASQASSNKAGRFFLDRWHPLSQKADVNGHV
jgi:hypothetical protein